MEKMMKICREGGTVLSQEGTEVTLELSNGYIVSFSSLDVFEKGQCLDVVTDGQPGSDAYVVAYVLRLYPGII